MSISRGPVNEKEAIVIFVPEMGTQSEWIEVECVHLCVFVHMYLLIGSPVHWGQLFFVLASSYYNKVNENILL